jgi:hypothetical protein
MVSDWNCFKYFCIYFLYCNDQVHTDFLITLYKTYCFSTTTVVTRTRFSVTLYVLYIASFLQRTHTHTHTQTHTKTHTRTSNHRQQIYRRLQIWTVDSNLWLWSICSLHRPICLLIYLHTTLFRRTGLNRPKQVQNNFILLVRRIKDSLQPWWFVTSVIKAILSSRDRLTQTVNRL